MSSSTSRSSGFLTTDTQVWTGRALLCGVAVTANGIDAATVTIHDGFSAGGQVLAKVIVDAGLTHEEIIFDRPVVGEAGLFADVTGTGAEYIVYTG